MKKILHVEDESQVTDLVGLALKDEYDYTPVESAEEAIELIESDSFDLVIIDLKLLPEKKINGHLRVRK